MKFYRSILISIVVLVTWFTLSLRLPEVAALERSQLGTDFSQTQQYAMRLMPLQVRFLELESLVKDKNWSEVQSFLRGPLGDLEVRLRFLENSFSLSQRGEASKRIDNLSEYLAQLDSSAVVGNQQQSLEKFYALVTEFNEVLSLAGAGDVSLAQGLPAEGSIKKKTTNTLTQKAKSMPIGALTNVSSEGAYSSYEKEKQKLSKKHPITELNSYPLNKITDVTLEKSRTTMDASQSPDLTYLALILLVPLTIYLQIRHQRKNQENQNRVAELEGKIEALNQDKASLGSALEQAQGRLVAMFMNLEETKPLARLHQKRTITVEEQEALIQENDSFVQALLKQAQETVSPEENH
ncbi:MAG: photosystem II protein PsbQ [Thermosynechococcaceae cyanobacterium]